MSFFSGLEVIIIVLKFLMVITVRERRVGFSELN